jgi:hypothetical protein
MVHRDIKPHNLMLTPTGVVKVLDFGLARVRSEHHRRTRLTQLEEFMGTPEYVAPEQAMNARDVDTRADIYSLGCTLYALLVGRPPFQERYPTETVLAHIEKECRPVCDVRPDVPAELAAVVAKMLAKDPARRHQRPIEVAQALAPFAKAGGKPLAGGKALVAPGVREAGAGTQMVGNASRMKGLSRGASSPPVEAPKALHKGSPFNDLADAPVPPKKARADHGRARAALLPLWKRPGVVAGAIGTSLALILMVLIVIKVRVESPGSNPVQAKSPPDEASSQDGDLPKEESSPAKENPKDLPKEESSPAKENPKDLQKGSRRRPKRTPRICRKSSPLQRVSRHCSTARI